MINMNKKVLELSSYNVKDFSKEELLSKLPNGVMCFATCGENDTLHHGIFYVNHGEVKCITDWIPRDSIYDVVSYVNHETGGEIIEVDTTTAESIKAGLNQVVHSYLDMHDSIDAIMSGLKHNDGSVCIRVTVEL